MATAYPVHLIEVVADKLPTKLNQEWAVELLDAIEAAGYVVVDKQTWDRVRTRLAEA